MGIVQRKERQKAELRQLILDAARRIVVEDGFRELSMRRIAEAIEYAPATIYLYFENRDEIALQLVREGFAELVDFLGPAATMEDPYERLFALARRYVDFAREKPETYRLIFMEDPRFSSHVIGSERMKDPAEPGFRAFELLHDTVAALIERGTFRPVDPGAAAQVLWFGLHGLISMRLTCPEFPYADQEELSGLMTLALMRGFSAS